MEVFVRTALLVEMRYTYIRMNALPLLCRIQSFHYNLGYENDSLCWKRDCCLHECNHCKSPLYTVLLMKRVATKSLIFAPTPSTTLAYHQPATLLQKPKSRILPCRLDYSFLDLCSILWHENGKCPKENPLMMEAVRNNPAIPSSFISLRTK